MHILLQVMQKSLAKHARDKAPPKPKTYCIILSIYESIYMYIQIQLQQKHSKIFTHQTVI